jgi:hypothetical protein
MTMSNESSILRNRDCIFYINQNGLGFYCARSIQKKMMAWVGMPGSGRKLSFPSGDTPRLDWNQVYIPRQIDVVFTSGLRIDP